jgi:hypothetical protein
MTDLNQDTINKAKALSALDDSKDMTLKEVAKAAFGLATKYTRNVKDVASKGLNLVIPDDPKDRAVREAENHVNNANRTDKTRFAVNVATNKVGSFVKGAVIGLKDSLNENIRGKASKGARQVLSDAVDGAQPPPVTNRNQETSGE